jgi:predicted Ser/Thr protein kinase
MKLPICLIGEDSLALASLKQQLEKEASVSVDPRIYGYGEAFEMLKGRGGVVVAEI